MDVLEKNIVVWPQYNFTDGAMGMLFNTVNTGKILQMLGNYFGINTLSRLNPSDFQNWPLANGTYAYLKSKGLWFPNDASLDSKWQKWLGRFDKHVNQRKSNNEKTATTVGNAIYSAISNNVTQIEFFAVPDDIPHSTHISAEAGTVTDPGGAVTEWITVYTLTHDKVSDTAGRVLKKRPTRK